MKKLLGMLVVIALMMLPLSSYGKDLFIRSQGHTGGQNGKLDKPTGTDDQDMAIVLLNDDATYGNAFFPYTLDVDGGAGDDVPYHVNAADGGNERWELLKIYSSGDMSKKFVEHNTANHTLDVQDCGGFFTNTGDVNDITYTLLECVAATEGWYATFMVTDTGNEFWVDPNANDMIADICNANGDKIEGDQTLGSMVTVICVQCGDTPDYDMITAGRVGAWTDAD